MPIVLARNWGWVALRGVVALIFGLLTLFQPAITVAALVLLFGAYVFVDGISMIVSAIRNRGAEAHWVAVLVGGIAGIGAGIVTFVMPGVTALVLLYFIAAWAIIRGIAEIMVAIRLRKAIEGEWLLGLAGALSLVFGIFVAVFPGAGALAVLLWIGVWSILLGVVLIALGLRLRAFTRTGTATAAPASA